MEYAAELNQEETSLSGSPELSPTPFHLIFHPLHRQRPEPTGVKTPPLRRPGSIPFHWEEAPGRPRRSLHPDRLDFAPDSSSKPNQTASPGLDLPPCLAGASHGIELSSPASCYGFPLRKKHCNRKGKHSCSSSSSSRSTSSSSGFQHSSSSTAHLWGNFYGSVKQLVSSRRDRKVEF
ncbi:hypothetical protein HPP92_003652 [Vanilla planifolia]|uniref:Uncharacterized protein n=1 Tax=Vanilla planifolia TaxID=51239 RepID=A0A835S2R8_VANPL|nr:hypothetical protein HPP92_003652 [Vanilla planifolia]